MKHETFIERWLGKSPELCDEVSEQAIKLSGAETILTFKNTFGNIWKKLEVTFGLRLIYEQSLREIHLIGWRLAFSF